MKQYKILPAFIDSAQGKLFVAEYIPAPSCENPHSVIFIPPFAEEMNRCRRMISEQARALARNGFRAVVFDLYGTGDSEGDFCEARWEIWCEDISSVLSWSAGRACANYSIVAIRLGALLALNSTADIAGNAEKIVLWNPCASGKVFLRQFLRLKLVSQMNVNESDRETVSTLMQEFSLGKSVEVAGYELSADLARSIEIATLELTTVMRKVPVYWFELVSSEGKPLSVATRNMTKALLDCNVPISVSSIPGDKFWDTVETSTVPRLIEATTAVFVDI